MNPRRTDAEAAYWHAVRAKLPNAAENENRCRTFLAIGTVEELEDLGIQSNYLHHAVFDEKLSGSRIVEVSLPGYLYAPFVLNDNPVRAEIPYDLVAGKRSIGLPVGLPLVNERERMSQFPPTRPAARRAFFGDRQRRRKARKDFFPPKRNRLSTGPVPAR